MNKKKTKYISAGIVVIILILLALPKIDFSKGSDNPNADRGGGGMGGALSVEVIVVEPQPLQDIIFTSGTILANEEIEIRSEINGKIEKIYFNEGRKVQRGDMLIKINDDELQAQLLRTSYRKKLAEDREYRQRILLEKEGISQQDYDVALNELKTFEAEIALIKAQIEKTEIKAPFSGIIGLRYVSEGSYISPTTSIARLQDISRVKVEFSIPERHISMINTGERIKFNIEGSSKSFEGTVYAVEPKIDPTTRTLKMRALCTNTNDEILPGAFARINLTLKEYDDALLVPTESIVPEIGGQKVFVVKDGRAAPVNVETGIRTDKKIQITSGLQPGDSVLTTGLLQVRPGMPLSVAKSL